MIVLAIDTCDSRGSVALLREDSVLGFVAHVPGEEYSSWLLPAVSRVLSSRKRKLETREECAMSETCGSPSLSFAK